MLPQCYAWLAVLLFKVSFNDDYLRKKIKLVWFYTDFSSFSHDSESKLWRHYFLHKKLDRYYPIAENMYDLLHRFTIMTVCVCQVYSVSWDGHEVRSYGFMCIFSCKMGVHPGWLANVCLAHFQESYVSCWPWCALLLVRSIACAIIMQNPHQTGSMQPQHVDITWYLTSVLYEKAHMY